MSDSSGAASEAALLGTGRYPETEHVTDAMTGRGWQWDPSLYAGSALYYVRGRGLLVRLGHVLIDENLIAVGIG